MSEPQASAPLVDFFLRLPLLCRALAALQAGSWLVGVLFPVVPRLLAFCAAPCARGQLWRLVASPAAPRGRLETLCALFVLARLLPGLERELGSVHLGLSILAHALFTNLAALVLSLAFSGAGGPPDCSVSSAVPGPRGHAQGGLLPFALAAVAVMALRSKAAKLPLCGRPVRKELVPLCFWLVLAILGGSPVYDGLAMGCGYLAHYGVLRRVSPLTKERLRALERHPRVAALATRPGFVAADDAEGGAMQLPVFEGDGAGGAGEFLGAVMQRANAVGGAIGGGARALTDGTAKAFTGSGRKLGAVPRETMQGTSPPLPQQAQAATQPSSEEQRSAALAAAERRAASTSQT